MDRVVITGSTGLIGTALTQHLAASHTIISLIRGTPQGKESEQGSASQKGISVLWRPDQPAHAVKDADLAVLEGCSAVIHLAGANVSAQRWTSSYKQTILSSRTDSSQSLIAILSRLQTKPKVLVCASAIGIYGDRGDEVLTEVSTHGKGFLPEICEAWEASPDAAKTLGIRVVHLRFGVVLAPAGGAMKKLLPVFKAGLGGRLGSGRQWVSWVTLTDVVRAIAYSVATEDAAGVYNVTAPNPVTNLDFTHALAAALHRPAPWIVPAFALKLAFGQMAEDTLLASSRVLPARLHAEGFTFLEPVIGPALHAMLYR